MRRALAIVVVLGCGRVGFDPQPHGASDAATDTATDTMPSGTDAVAIGDAASLPPGPALWLRMDSGPAGGIVDSARGHTVSCVTSCPTATAGHHGGGYAFANQEIDVTYAADLDAANGFTGALWVLLPASPASVACVFTLPFDNSMGFDTFSICIDTNDNTLFDSESPAGVANTLAGQAIVPGGWHHLAMSWDGTTKRGYYDGVEVVSQAVQIGHGTEDPAIGDSRGFFHVDGTLDDVLYYTRALSAAEVAQLASP